MEAAEEEDWCGLFTCVCRWRPPQCSPRIHHVAPGYDYVSLPADADGRRPAWSLLVGFSDDTKLRLHRLHVARSGRILGRSNDALEIFHDLGKLAFSASASLAPDGVSLYVLHQDDEAPPQALQLQLGHADATEEELPPLPTDPEVPLCSISAAGHIWAAYIKFLFESREFGIVMLRLLREDGQSRWEQVGEPVVGPDDYSTSIPWGGRFLQGCTVLPLCGGNRTLLLVSIKLHSLFFTFDCSTSAWAQVDTTPESCYIPILGHGVYIQEDETVYTCSEKTPSTHTSSTMTRIAAGSSWSRLSRWTLFALSGPDRRLSSWSRLSRWTLFAISAAGSCAPSRRNQGLALHLPPDRHAAQYAQSRHPSILLPTGVQGRGVLSHSPLLQLEEDPISTALAPLVLDCCRRNLLPNQCPPSSVVPVKLRPAIAHIKPDLFIICQAGTQSIVYNTNVIDDSSGRLERDDGKLLKQLCSIASYGDGMLEEQPPPRWHFLCDSSSIYAVSGIEDGRHVIGFRNKLPTFDPRFRRIAAGPFVMAIRVGYKTIALTDALEVFEQTHISCSNQSSWLRYHIDQSHVPNKKVKLSGYAALGEDSFIVNDTVTNSCLLFDLNVKQWRVVMPYAKLEFRGSHQPSHLYRSCLLNGRSVFVDGFIYTCVDGGLDAYELLQEGDSVFLSCPIFLPFSPDIVWDIVWKNKMMCLDYAGKDTSGGIIFFVVQGQYPPTWPKHHVRIITVHVNTEKTLGEKMKPVEVGHLDSVTRFFEHEKGVVRLSARNCFAFSSCASDAP
ncbi:unnamed protein product [Alopecurus aequalis]